MNSVVTTDQSQHREPPAPCRGQTRPVVHGAVGGLQERVSHCTLWRFFEIIWRIPYDYLNVRVLTWTLACHAHSRPKGTQFDHMLVLRNGEPWSHFYTFNIIISHWSFFFFLLVVLGTKPSSSCSSFSFKEPSRCRLSNWASHEGRGDVNRETFKPCIIQPCESLQINLGNMFFLEAETIISSRCYFPLLLVFCCFLSFCFLFPFFITYGPEMTYLFKTVLQISVPPISYALGIALSLLDSSS